MLIRKTKGFTLADVLITLGIIGIVAAMTLPTLIQKNQEKVTVTQLKKAYNILSQAYMSAVNENGTPDNWGLTHGLEEHNTDNPDEKSNSSLIVLNKLAPHLKIMKNCGQKSGCFPIKYLDFNGNPITTQSPDSTKYFAKAQLADGTIFFIDVHNISCNANYGISKKLQNVCGTINVDINGFKPPNQNGRDKFIFWYTKYGIEPLGSAMETTNNNFDSCKKGGTGNGCTAWVIYNEDMDYLHCDDLSWNGKKKCK